MIVTLSADHPGFHDRTYRARRNAIAERAQAFQAGAPFPHVRYTPAENQVWQLAWQGLRLLHRNWVCEPLRAAQERLGLGRGALPQLSELDPWLAPTGFRMEPVPGLVEARAFLQALSEGVFLSTQYVRHPSRPDYTPEPDVIHELVGHAASLAVPEVAALNRAFGAAARGASAERMLELERLYWWTLEFGAVLEQGRPRALGAGLLSSAQELGRLQRVGVEAWSPERLARTPYDPTQLQPALYVAPSWEHLVRELLRWLS